MVYLARKTIAGKRYFYLVKSLKVEGEVHKIQRYLGSKEPSPHDLTRLEQTHASWFEAKAVERKARVSASKYRSQYLAPDIIEALEQIHFRHLAARRLLSANELIRANQHFKVSHFQNTLSLAGVELTRGQLMEILMDDVLPTHITLTQVKLLMNLEELFDTLNQTRGLLDLSKILKLHTILSRGVLQDDGKIRQEAATLQGSSFVPIPSVLLKDELDNMVTSQVQHGAELHPFESICEFHHRWGQLHPFTSGNGLLGREIFNYQLGSTGFPPFLFPPNRDRYLSSLRAADANDMQFFINRFARDYIENHHQLLGHEGGFENAVRARQGQSKLDLFNSVTSLSKPSIVAGFPSRKNR